MVRKLSASLLGAVVATSLLSGAAVAAEWRGWNIHVEGYPNTIAMDKFAELLAEKTGGEVTLQMFHGGTLGSQPDAIEQVRLEFAPDGIKRIAEIAWHVNERTENIGARRLHTVMEKLLEAISYTATEQAGSTVTVLRRWRRTCLLERAVTVRSNSGGRSKTLPSSAPLAKPTGAVSPVETQHSTAARQFLRSHFSSLITCYSPTGGSCSSGRKSIRTACFGISNTKALSGNCVAMSQSMSAAVNWGAPASRFCVMTSLRGSGVSLSSIHICQSISSCRNARW